MPIAQGVWPLPHVTSLASRSRAQLPRKQTVPIGQAVPQVPQLASSLVLFTQRPLQTAWLSRQIVPHIPPPHTWPVAQAALQVPQWARSFEMSVQRPPQSI